MKYAMRLKSVIKKEEKMKKTSIWAGFTCIISCFFVIIALSGCFSPWQDQSATLTINLGGRPSGRAVTPYSDDLGLTYTLTLSGPTNTTIDNIEQGSQALTVSVVPGHYDITLTASLNGAVYAQGKTTAEALPGRSVTVSVNMRYAEESVNITITGPATGGTPNSAASVPDGTNYTCGPVIWSPAVEDTFVADTAYTATVTLTANENFTFAGIETGTINGNNATTFVNTGTTITLSYTFAKTLEKTIKSIAIENEPTKTTYKSSENLELDGLKVKLIYDDEDDSYEEIEFADFGTKNISTIPADGTQLFYSTYKEGISVIVRVGDNATETSVLIVNPLLNIGVFTTEQWLDALAIIKDQGDGTPGDALSEGYTIILMDNFTAPGVTEASSTFGNVTGISVIIKNKATANKTITLSSQGSLLYLKSGQKVTLENTQLVGYATNNTSLVYVDSTEFTMKGDAQVKNNSSSATTTAAPTGGIGVYVTGSGAKFTMEGDSSVSGNARSGTSNASNPATGVGVYVNGGTFTMSENASVKDNKRSGGVAGTTASSTYGVGVYVKDGTFTMSGNASVKNNTRSNPSQPQGSKYTYGVGVCIEGSTTFTMSGNATVSANTFTVNIPSVTLSGGGVYVKGSNAKFTMEGESSVSSNTAPNYGGGVYVEGGTFTMKDDGSVSDNNATGIDNGSVGYGGGVYVGDSGTFIMNGGTISSNTANSTGAGVYVLGSTFTMKGSAIVKDNKIEEDDPDKGTMGGGVYVAGTSTFTMEGGTIGPDNSAVGGGGVCVNGTGTEFTMSGSATVSGNTGSGNTGSMGCGVLVYEGGTFTMKGTSSVQNNNKGIFGGGVCVNGTGTEFTMSDSASVSGNITTTYGGSVYVNGGTFTMSDSASVSGNEAPAGGGVYVDSNGTFLMLGGTVKSNKASDTGGGVYVNTSGTFHMVTGTVYGIDGNDNANIDSSSSSSTAALYVNEYAPSPGIAQYGTINSDGDFVPTTTNQPGVNLSTSNNTITVTNGVKSP
jgi:hypothetical protein